MSHWVVNGLVHPTCGIADYVNTNPDIAHKAARILIVDDEHHNRQVLEAMLRPEGFVILKAASGEEALEMISAQPPDLVLLDIMMPGIDGYAVASQIKSNPASTNVPIIMISALNDRSSKMLGLSAGAEDFLSKPVDRAELCVRVRNLLRLKAYGDYYALEQVRLEQMRFKNEFLSHVSHELRSPLTAIKQFSSIIMNGSAGELNAEQRQYQQIVLKNIRQLQSMIDDLLEVTRLETGKISVEPADVSVEDAVTDTLHTLDFSARAKHITVTTDIPADLPPAYADQTRVRQILIILLDNAIKFSDDGDLVHVRASSLPDDPRFLLVEVSDFGCGISPEKAEQVFERLYQVPSEPTAGGRKGLGLGLYICKELVGRQGGRIWVMPNSPKGCVFSFTLPVPAVSQAMGSIVATRVWGDESVRVTAHLEQSTTLHISHHPGGFPS